MLATGTTSPRHGTPKRPDPARVSPAHQHRILSAIHPEPLRHTLTDPAIPPLGVLAGQPPDKCPDVAPGRPAGPAARGLGGPAAADDVAVPAHDRVWGDHQPQSIAPRFRYDAEQAREQSPVRPVQLRSSRLAAAAARRAGGAGSRSPRSSTSPHAATARNPAATRVVRRNTNRRHMISDHHGQTASRATLLVRAMDEISGTHRWSTAAMYSYLERAAATLRKHQDPRCPVKTCTELSAPTARIEGRDQRGRALSLVRTR